MFGTIMAERFRKSWMILNLLCVSWIIELQATTRRSQFALIDGYSYTETFKTTTTRSSSACLVLCTENQTCASVNFNRDQKICELTGTDGTVLMAHAGWKLYIAIERVNDSPYSLSGATAKQSTTSHNAPAPRAIDGKFYTRWNQLSCTHTPARGPHWWRVDFGVLFVVGHVIIYNRTDCCAYRLRYLTISVSPTIATLGDTGNICATLGSTPGPNPVSFTCTHKLAGQYLRIYKDTTLEGGSTALTLCEVVVKR